MIGGSHRLFRAAIASAMAAALSGCIAAAIPVVAGGLMIGGRGGDENAEEASESGIARVDTPVASATGATVIAPEARAAAEAELVAVPGLSEELPAAVEAEAVEAPPPAVEAAPQLAIAPQTRAAASQGNREPLSLRAYDAFYSYVDAQARRDPVEQTRDSALLSAPALLRPDRTECSIRPPAVVIDLDPGEDAFDHAIIPAPNTGLSQMLNAMRMQEIEVFWISKLPAVQAGAVRRALSAAGLDPAGNDRLLLMRNGDDRKQERRRELSQTHCILAIAGDTRADFDELYLYLKDRSAAQPLEELVGAGWFLTPLPLEQGTP